jgi:hypothetical protein
MARGDAFAKQPFLGQWRIVAMDLWTADDLDLLSSAHLTLERGGLGRLGFLAIEAGLDYRVGKRDGGPAVEFSFEGSDEGDLITGRGWAILAGDELRGRIFIHRGDGSGFTARRSECAASRRKRTA